MNISPSRRPQDKIQYYCNLLQAHDNSFKATQSFNTQLGKRIAYSLSELKEISRILMAICEGTIKVIIDKEKQMRLLSMMYDKLAYLSLGCIIKEQDSSINLHQVMVETIELYSKEIFTSELSISFNISKELNHFHFDELLFRQILANILRESILCSKLRSKIDIQMIYQQVAGDESLIIIVKDGGLGVSLDMVYPLYNPGIQEDEKEEMYFLPLELNFTTLRKIVISLQGELSMETEMGIGKTIYLSLLYNTR
jgi:K+-sensing histidine kinase KdpD